MWVCMYIYIYIYDMYLYSIHRSYGIKNALATQHPKESRLQNTKVGQPVMHRSALPQCTGEVSGWDGGGNEPLSGDRCEFR